MLKRFVIKKNERGALLRDGDFERLLDAGRHYFLDPLGRLSVATWKLDAPMNDVAIVDYLLQHEPETAAGNFARMELGEDEAGLRYENEVLVEVLPPGVRRFFWKGQVTHRLDKVDLRAGYTLAPGLAAHLVQPALRGRAVAGLGGLLIAAVPAYHVGVLRVDGFGIEVGSVGVKDIVLPGEMKTILAQVVEATKSAEANVIRRREETAATRSLLNTARVMEDNPTALRLKELETLERVAERIDRISVFGGLDQVLNGLVNIKG